ncbi:formate dehydrogenase (plasmid) [Paracoccus versutus]|jgi:formate dehydrogenase subunit delta|uniref:Formate dehydrogenase subunit delta n=1 Tax=Paracoccus versutus TaxID=34007 RepID=A0A099FHF6_PARVE|nr:MULTISPECIES: formate dehydrogenase subunit delta [Paracoccus]WGR62627.1 formate dehydrogenase [Paracoccus ferrooxidans]SFX83897.1 formate dehydrogenase subunit delta [Paracoccus pantotrophus]KGJ09989.1 formate dehydrogenase [Paracoccus versutus]MBT0781582.1 formate dehydrogenase subunit delta [Paracoccus sp. pheM1]MCJ1900295.1 formate dehydrogenase subunit delta [Paracoccus versutus]
MSHDHSKLIRMASQMAQFFGTQPDRPAPEAVAAHINESWTPRMRQDFVDQIRAGAEADPVVREAAAFVRLPAA